MQAPTSSTKPRVICPRGQHLCRCVQIVDLGTQHFQPGDDGSRKLYFGFETSILRHTFKDENGPEPFMLQTEFAFYMGSTAKKTKLRTFIETWFGKPFPDDKAAGAFDFSSLLGKAVVLTVSHKPKTDGSMKAVIVDQCLPMKIVNGVETPMPKNEVPPAVNPLICYEVTSGENDQFAKLPEFLRKKIQESDEFVYPKQPSAPMAAPSEPPLSSADDPDLEVQPDEIPFAFVPFLFAIPELTRLFS